jgi:3-polyprenyl-4-hydroxybenzoate decarboxylase
MSSALAQRPEPGITPRFRLRLSNSTLFAGVTVILLAAPGFYHQPTSVEDLVDFMKEGSPA